MSKSDLNSGCLGAIFALFARPAKSDTVLHFKVQEDFLSKAELSFYRYLVNAVGADLAVFPKVRMGDVLSAGNGPGSLGANNKVRMKHVDFVLCHPKSLKIVAAVELDDKSHAREDRVARDNFVEKAFESAGLPLIRVPAKAGYDSAALRSLVGQKLGWVGSDAVAEK